MLIKIVLFLNGEIYFFSNNWRVQIIETLGVSNFVIWNNFRGVARDIYLDGFDTNKVRHSLTYTVVVLALCGHPRIGCRGSTKRAVIRSGMTRVIRGVPSKKSERQQRVGVWGWWPWWWWRYYKRVREACRDRIFFASFGHHMLFWVGQVVQNVGFFWAGPTKLITLKDELYIAFNTCLFAAF